MKRIAERRQANITKWIPTNEKHRTNILKRKTPQTKIVKRIYRRTNVSKESHQSLGDLIEHKSKPITRRINWVAIIDQLHTVHIKQPERRSVKVFGSETRILRPKIRNSNSEIWKVSKGNRSRGRWVSKTLQPLGCRTLATERQLNGNWTAIERKL